MNSTVSTANDPPERAVRWSYMDHWRSAGAGGADRPVARP